MDIISILLITGGLFVFETITSIDNAIINAEVLRTMKENTRRWFSPVTATSIVGYFFWKSRRHNKKGQVV